jgi:hypothetical protein
MEDACWIKEQQSKAKQSGWIDGFTHKLQPGQFCTPEAVTMSFPTNSYF